MCLAWTLSTNCGTRRHRLISPKQIWPSCCPRSHPHRFLKRAGGSGRLYCRQPKEWNHLGSGSGRRPTVTQASVQRLYTHRLTRPNGKLFAVAMLHTDGWGPFRLLLDGAPQKIFPQGYRVAIPEMSCGLAISRQLEGPEQTTIEDIGAKCFGDGSRPRARGIFDPEELLSSGSLSLQIPSLRRHNRLARRSISQRLNRRRGLLAR